MTPISERRVPRDIVRAGPTGRLPAMFSRFTREKASSVASRDRGASMARHSMK